MFYHKHPFEPFIPKNATKLIIGTLPPPRFTTGDLKPDDVNFCYGSCDGQLWPILDAIFKLNLIYDNSQKAVNQRKEFLIERGIGICDIVEIAKRKKIDASDLGMQNIELRDILGYLKVFPKIKTLLFTGGNSKNGPEYLFRKHLKSYGLKLKVVSNEVPRIHQFKMNCHSERSEEFPETISLNQNSNRLIKTVSLTAPSGAANRAVGSMQLYKQLKAKNPDFNTLDFRIMQYREFF